MKKILYLTLKKKWFDLIKSGEIEMGKTKYRYKEVVKLMEFECPKCGVTIQQASDTGKVINIISTGKVIS